MNFFTITNVSYYLAKITRVSNPFHFHSLHTSTSVITLILAFAFNVPNNLNPFYRFFKKQSTYPLNLVNMINVCTLRITATAGTNLGRDFNINTIFILLDSCFNLSIIEQYSLLQYNL
ncbi:hypothetical protein G7K_6881-t1 [Saitoella complicata NRRL Y-17804]|uniref:Uncharacterized protein n=1 Tax=Saitoella complicata (strain BCRC 22490 / CBS 7301 / JCM 7358 / NBRC 10748 / NRRL Y-17804) TaxID=698492 RepID=A0A0E9NSH6_SAICN|nr:hypothetical protein G7K_6881-t1 [Saitoella complicata NRRL Y-17804]